MNVLSTILEVVGLCALVLAAYLFDYRLAIAVAGAELVLVGFALGAPRGGGRG